eukprot:gene9009-biopygen3963
MLLFLKETLYFSAQAGSEALILGATDALGRSSSGCSTFGLSVRRVAGVRLSPHRRDSRRDPPPFKASGIPIRRGSSTPDLPDTSLSVLARGFVDGPLSR